MSSKSDVSKDPLGGSFIDLIHSQTPLNQIARQKRLKMYQAVEKLEALVKTEQDMDLGYLRDEVLKYAEIEKVLNTSNTSKLKPIYDELEQMFSYPNIRFARAVWWAETRRS